MAIRATATANLLIPGAIAQTDGKIGLTMMGWVRPTTITGFHGWMGTSTDVGFSAEAGFICEGSGSQVAFYHYATDGGSGAAALLSPTGTLVIDRWCHVAFTAVSLGASGVMRRIYVNGRLSGSNISTILWPTAGRQFTVGNSDTDVVSADIAYVKVFNRALTALEVNRCFLDVTPPHNLREAMTVDLPLHRGVNDVINRAKPGSIATVSGTWTTSRQPPAPNRSSAESIGPYLVQAPSGTPATATPGVINIPFAFPAPTVSAGITTTPGAFNVPIAFPLATVKAGATATPGAFNVPFTFPAPTPGAGATPTPGAISVPFTFYTPTPVFSSIPTPGAFNVPFAFPAPTVTAGTNATVTPGAFNVAFAFPTAAISLGAGATPGAFNLPIAFFTPAVGAGATALPGAFNIPVTFFTPAVTAGTGATATPGVIGITFAFPTAAILRGAGPQPGAFNVPFTFWTPTVSAGGGGVVRRPPIAISIHVGVGQPWLVGR